MKNSYHSDSLRFSFLKLAFPAKLAIVWLHIDLILYIKSMSFTSLKVREEQHGLYTRESEHIEIPIVVTPTVILSFYDTFYLFLLL